MRYPIDTASSSHPFASDGNSSAEIVHGSSNGIANRRHREFCADSANVVDAGYSWSITTGSAYL
jgi:hypothetical protein